MVGGLRPGDVGAAPAAVDGAGQHTHAAAVIGSSGEALAAAVPFMDAGLRAGDLVVLSCSLERNDLLRRELGARATDVQTDARISLLDTRAPDALVAIRKLLEQAAGSRSGRVRLVGETRFGLAPRDWREGQRYESVINTLLSAEPIDALCFYDRRSLPAEVVDSAAATHPVLLVDGVARPNPHYLSPPDYLARLPLPREPLEDGDPVFAVDDAPVLAALRHQLAAALATVVPDREQREDLHIAVSEIAANAFRHGGPPVSARLWAAADRLVCTIRDRGTGYGDVLAGFQPAHGADLSRGGMGLWLARKLWDHVDLLPSPDGLTVRLSSALR
ncbi:Anti-sigma regulatory factor (Ser/Thr protein kinase) [Modestobacter sp. DSM 44400]|uniref:sensor histidine kinase n=1 Tax=Modestobacter sp. DSM 44400 TaxID=1550230 RepID=UPI000896A80E|nr:sensor histidine kinase [Modestobacter sp. DSM 44400]SDY10516.1 Anti-sigma regulatory factor (Ser/Thr protein kinase) [Modestobacter sp. DSM 44400]